MTIDAMGTQTAIAEKIRLKRGDYVLALKENQRTLHEDVSLYLNDAEIKEELRKKGKYKKQLKSPQPVRNPRILPDERNWLAASEEGLERAKKYWDGRKDDSKRRSGEKRVPLLYQQPK